MSASQRAAMTPSAASVLDSLSPTPAFARIDGPAVALDSRTEVERRPQIGALLGAEEELTPIGSEGYALRVTSGPDGPRILLAANTDEGAFRGLATVERLRELGSVPELSIRDEPALSWRGTIEGFYGPPWSHDARLAHLRFCAANKFNSYAYAPKDDRFHRARWRDLYPEDQLARLKELVEEATRLHIRFTYTLAPGLSMVYSSADEMALLLAKAEQLWSIGVRSFALLFDDIPETLQHEADLERFGSGPGATGVAHGQVCTEFQDRFLTPRGGERLVMVPTDYAGTARSAYRDALAGSLPADALVWWTGSDIVVGEISRADIDAAAASYDRDLLLWDNFPVNDFDFPRVFLGPLLGRTSDIAGSRLVGINANPMIHATASQFSLVTVADWAWNPGAYDPDRSAARALRIVAGASADALRPLVAAASAWPPDAERSAHFSGATSAALAGDAEALERLDAALRPLVALPETLGDRDEPLLAELQPWIAAAAREAEIARAATAILASGRAPSHAERQSLQADLDALAAHEPDVLRTLLSDYTKAVLTSTP
jgi:hyaluronoglucosaminidase